MMLSMRMILLAILLALAGCKAERQQLGQALSGKPPVLAGSLVGRWIVADLNGGGRIEAASLEFAAGSIAGSSGCNRLSGSWRQEGAALAIGPLASTRMACAPAVMAVEQRLLATLAAVQSVVFDDRGNPTLISPDGRRVRLIPALPEPVQ